MRIGLGQQHADHHPNLRLVAVAGADDALLHQIRRVFGDRHAGPRGHHHGNSARLSELERRLGVLVDEGRLDRRLVGAELVENAHQAVVNGKQPFRKRRPDRSVVTEPQARKPSRLPAISTMPQPVRRSPGSMPRMRIGRTMPVRSSTAGYEQVLLLGAHLLHERVRNLEIGIDVLDIVVLVQVLD